MRFTIPFLVFVAMIGLLWKSLRLSPTEIPSVLIGQKAPPFCLKTLNAPYQEVDEKIFKSRVTILNVWASWCSSCKKEHSTWLAITQKYSTPIIGVNYHDDLEEAQQWLKKEGDPYQLIVFDQHGRLGMDYGVYGIPETFIIDKEGVIRYRHAGPISLQLWQNDLLPIIERLNKPDDARK